VWAYGRHPVPGPPVTCRPRRLAPDRLAVAKAEFEARVSDGTARRSESSWSSALHLVPKKDNGWRPCGDYRALNSRTIPDRYPVPHIHDYSHQLSGCRFYSKIDLVRAYNQIPVHPRDIQKTAITSGSPLWGEGIDALWDAFPHINCSEVVSSGTPSGALNGWWRNYACVGIWPPHCL
jgi:hypothetical protein